MRLAPILSGTARAAGKDLVIKGYRVPKGVSKIFSYKILAVKFKTIAFSF